MDRETDTVIDEKADGSVFIGYETILDKVRSLRPRWVEFTQGYLNNEKRFDMLWIRDAIESISPGTGVYWKDSPAQRVTFSRIQLV